jgi:hypothetical protein
MSLAETQQLMVVIISTASIVGLFVGFMLAVFGKK